MALNTGMRAGEIWGLKSMDYLSDTSLLWVRRQQDRVIKSFAQVKGKKPRFVPCNDELARELRNIMIERSLKPDETFFQTEEGNPICHDNFADRQFTKDIKDWGGKRIRFHDLRHTFATLLISSGVDLKTVKEIMGHVDIKTTMEYSHLIAGVVGKVAKTFSISATMAQGKEESPKLQLAQ